MDPVTVQYSPTREEVFRWYLRLWQKTIWKVHLLMFCVPVMLIALPMLVGKKPYAPQDLLGALAVGAALVAVMWAYPLFMFKPAPRILTADESGIRTSIGKKSGMRKWADVGAVNESAEGGVIISVRNGNAFVIPPRAFYSAKIRADFVEAARNWHRAA